MLDACSRCNRNPGDLYVLGKKDVYFSVRYGGVLCSECQGTGSKIRLSPSDYRLLCGLFRLKVEDLRGVDLDPYNMKRVYRLLEDYLVFHTDCSMESFKYLRKIGI